MLLPWDWGYWEILAPARRSNALKAASAVVFLAHRAEIGLTRDVQGRCRSAPKRTGRDRFSVKVAALNGINGQGPQYDRDFRVQLSDAVADDTAFCIIQSRIAAADGEPPRSPARRPA